MVVGIISSACYLLCLLLFWPSLIISLVMGLIAWIMGSQDLQGIQSGELDSEGKSFVLAGYICGMVATILSIITLVTCLLLVVWFVNLFSGSRGFSVW
jgi:hypothetical protein